MPTSQEPIGAFLSDGNYQLRQSVRVGVLIIGVGESESSLSVGGCYKGPFRLYNLSVGFTILNIPSCSLSYYSGFLCFKLEVFRYFSREKMPSICSNFL